MTPEFCPVCGAEVPESAKACPECGACEETGWSEKATEQRLGLPDDDFDYNEFIKEEFSPPPRSAKPQVGWIWWGVAVLLLLLIALGFIF